MSETPPPPSGEPDSAASAAASGRWRALPRSARRSALRRPAPVLRRPAVRRAALRWAAVRWSRRCAAAQLPGLGHPVDAVLLPAAGRRCDRVRLAGELQVQRGRLRRAPRTPRARRRNFSLWSTIIGVALIGGPRRVVRRARDRGRQHAPRRRRTERGDDGDASPPRSRASARSRRCPRPPWRRRRDATSSSTRTSPGHYPTCPFLAITGWYCPGCGSLRAVHDLLHGDLAGAVRPQPAGRARRPVPGLRVRAPGCCAGWATTHRARPSSRPG